MQVSQGATMNDSAKHGSQADTLVATTTATVTCREAELRACPSMTIKGAFPRTKSSEAGVAVRRRWRSPRNESLPSPPPISFLIHCHHACDQWHCLNAFKTWIFSISVQSRDYLKNSFVDQEYLGASLGCSVSPVSVALISAPTGVSRALISDW